VVRLCSKEKKLLKSMKFPKEYDQKIPLKKIKWEVMKAWIATRVTELLGVEDEVLIGYIYEQLEGHDVSFSNHKPSVEFSRAARARRYASPWRTGDGGGGGGGGC
jgi:hypothetical protein